jgi:hypothetical protein
MAIRVKRTNQRLDRMMKFLLEEDRGIARDLLRRGYRVEAQAKRNVARNKDTGRLQASIHTKLEIKYGKPVVAVGTPLFYAVFIHEGTRPHGPVSAQRMAWFGRDGNPVFARWVRGINANPFLSDALTAARD